MGRRELVALLNLSSWCLLMVEWLFLVVPLGCLRFVIVVFPDHTHLFFLGWLKNITVTKYSPLILLLLKHKKFSSREGFQAIALYH